MAESRKISQKILTAATEQLQEKHFTKFDKVEQERVRYMCAVEFVSGLPPHNGVYERSPLLKSTGQTVTY